jgi:metallo-beta-lactamase class B
MRKLTGLTLAAFLLSPAAAQAADPYARARPMWNAPMKPFHAIGDIYYVGMGDTSAWLIFTLQGFILIDGGLPESAAAIEANIKTLGFDIKDVKILLNSHAHFDHAGGLAKLKRDSGARLIASAADKPILEKGHITYGPSAAPEDDYPPVKVDRVVKDGDTVFLGGVTLTAHLTPGHTPGCTSWTMPIVAGNQNHNVIFFCSITVGGQPLVNNRAYPKIAAELQSQLRRIAGDGGRYLPGAAWRPDEPGEEGANPGRQREEQGAGRPQSLHRQGRVPSRGGADGKAVQRRTGEAAGGRGR